MRSFAKPAPVTLRRPDGASAEYRLEDYLGECVWGYEKWNAERSWSEAQVRIGHAVEQATDGAHVELSDQDARMLAEANAAASVTGVFAPKIRLMQHAVAALDAPPTKRKRNSAR
jgi:hypothetical protein